MYTLVILSINIYMFIYTLCGNHISPNLLLCLFVFAMRRWHSVSHPSYIHSTIIILCTTPISALLFIIFLRLAIILVCIYILNIFACTIYDMYM